MGLHLICLRDKDLPLPIKYKRANRALSLATHPFDCTRSSRPYSMSLRDSVLMEYFSACRNAVVWSQTHALQKPHIEPGDLSTIQIMAN